MNAHHTTVKGVSVKTGIAAGYPGRIIFGTGVSG